MSELVDNAIALRILYLLINPFNRSDAFKYGIIDGTGKPLRKISQLKTTSERESYTMLHRLVFRLKRVLGTIPFGQTNFASYAAAYLLVKENLNTDKDPEDIEELFLSLIQSEDSISNLNESIKKEVKSALKDLNISEEGEGVPANSTAGIAGYELPFSKSKKKSKVKFKKVSKAIFKSLPKNENTLYKVGNDLIYID